MNTDDLDRDAYRRWWEATGRQDLTVCPCGETARSWATAGDRVVIQDMLRPGYGKCPRHRDMLAGREEFAQAILAGTFHERDLTDAEADKAQRVADGRPPYDA